MKKWRQVCTIMHGGAAQDSVVLVHQFPHLTSLIIDQDLDSVPDTSALFLGNCDTNTALWLHVLLQIQRTSKSAALNDPHPRINILCFRCIQPTRRALHVRRLLRVLHRHLNVLYLTTTDRPSAYPVRPIKLLLDIEANRSVSPDRDYLAPRSM